MMKKLLGLDQRYEQLQDLMIFGCNFDNMQVKLIQKYIKTVSHVSGIAQIQSIIKLLNQQNKNSLCSIKILIFLNLLLNQKQLNFNIIAQLVNQEINKILDLERKRYDKQKRYRQRQRQIQKSINKSIQWVKQTFSRSKDKQKLNINKSHSITQNTPRDDKKSNRSTSRSNHFSTIKQAKDIEDQTKQQIVISKIILPYTSYLLKLSSSNLKPILTINPEQLDSTNLWKLINLLKSVLKVTEGFTMMMRYFQAELSSLVTVMIQMLNNQIKSLYPIMQTYSKKKKQQIQKQLLNSQIYSQDNSIRLKFLEDLKKKYELDEFKEVQIEENGIKESALTLYRGSSLFNIIISLKINLPGKYMQQYDSQQNIVFQVFNLIDRCRKLQQTKRQRSIQKFQNQILSANLRKKLQQSKQKSKISKQNKSIDVLKPGILKQKQEEKKTINQKIQTQNSRENISTFRRMRMNVTQELSNQQTKTQRR